MSELRMENIQEFVIEYVKENPIPVTVAGLVFVGTILIFLRTKSRRLDRKIPNVKGGALFFGQVFEMIKGSPWDTMTKWSSQLGGIYRFNLFGSEPVCVSDPELIKVIFSIKLRTFKKDLEWTYKPFLDILGNGIVTADGHSWLNQRKLLSHHLRFDILDLIPNMAFKAYVRLCKKLDYVKMSNGVIEMAEEFRHLTLQVIAEALLSLSPEESDETFAKMYIPIVEEGNARTWNPERMYLPFPSWFKYRKDVKILNDYVTSLIEARWSLRLKEAEQIKNKITPDSRPSDILDKILEPISPDAWNEAAVRQIRDEIKTFVLAGHETSASMLAWSLFELSINPECHKRVLQEADAVYGNHFDAATGKLKSLPSREELQTGLVYTEGCLRESLRKYSIVPTVVRTAAEDVMLGDYFLPKGQTVMIGIQGVHHNPKYWPDPLIYKPERFLQPVAPYTFLPFIDGARVCLGQHLSLLESKIILSLLVKTYRFEVTNLKEAGQKHPYMVPIIPKTGHVMKVHNK